MSISNEKLLLISALAYYKELSDRETSKRGAKKITIKDVVDSIMKNDATTCFNNAFGYSDADLGMDKILSLIQSDEELLNLEIVYPEQKEDTSTSSVCLMNPDTKDVYVVFVGNYIDSPYTCVDNEGKITNIDTWVNNCQGAILRDTDEQKRDLDFYIEAIEAVRKEIGDDECDLNITVCGHSTGGNHAQYVTIVYGGNEKYSDINDIDQCVSFDGQGFPDAFLEYYRPLIKSRAGKITSYCPTVSIVGALFKTIEGINQKYIDIGRPDAIFIGLHMPSEFLDRLSES